MASSDPILIGTGIGPLNPISITLVSSGMAGSALSPADIGIYSFPSQIGVGQVGNANAGITVKAGSMYLITAPVPATFNVTAAGAGTFAGVINQSSGAAAIAFGFTGGPSGQIYGNGTGQFILAADRTRLFDKSSSTQWAEFNSAGLAMGSGFDIAVGNAFVATPQIPTGYLILRDVLGVAYKVSCNL